MGLWYFSLWALGLTGAEVSGFTVFSVALLGYKPLRDAVYRHSKFFWLVAIVFGLMLAGNVGVGEYHFTAPPELRLVFLAIGTGAACLLLPVIWKNGQTDSHASAKFIIGLILMIIVKIGFTTHNPAWPLMNNQTEGYNLFCSILGILAVFCSRTQHQQVASKDDERKRSQKNSPVLSTAVGFGVTLFWTHTFLTDGETIGRWVVQGHPYTGPSSLFCGIMVLFGMIWGLFVGLFRLEFTKSRIWWLIGSTSAISFYYLPPISAMAGFFMGCVFSVYVISLWIPLIALLNNAHIARTLTIGMSVFMALSFMQIYTVAYAFVPGGNILRERSWFVFAVCIILQFIFCKSFQSESTLKEKTHSLKSWSKNAFGVLMALLALFLLVRLQAPFYDGIDYEFDKSEVNYKSELIDENLTRIVLEEYDGLPVFTAAIWTIHFGLDMNMYSSHVRMKNLIEALNLDFVGLLESDTQRVVMGNRDVVQYLGEQLNMYVDYGPSTRDHTWGCSFLSRFPILKSTHHLLPSPNGELACAIHATCLVDNREIDFLISHNGQEEDELDRILQTTEISKIINASYNPTVFIVASPKSPNYYLLMKSAASPNNDEHFDWKTAKGSKGSVYDIQSTDSDRWCQYIGYKGPGISKLSYARVHHNHITDTELQTAKFLILPFTPTATTTSTSKDADGKSKPQTITKWKKAVRVASLAGHFDKLPSYFSNWKYPKQFYERGGWNGHYLHTFTHFWEKAE